MSGQLAAAVRPSTVFPEKTTPYSATVPDSTNMPPPYSATREKERGGGGDGLKWSETYEMLCDHLNRELRHLQSCSATERGKEGGGEGLKVRNKRDVCGHLIR